MIFLFGIGGWDLFTGAFRFSVADRIIYYLTIPVLINVWIDLDIDIRTQELGDLWEKFKPELNKAQSALRVIITLASILVPWLLSKDAQESGNTIIETLKNLQF